METVVEKYITPTKENPVFVAQNMFTGYCMRGCYKDWEVRNEKRWISGETTALTLLDAIQRTYEFINEHNEFINESTKFEIYMIDGSIDKFGDPIRIKCYSISMKQAKKFRII